MVWCNKCGKDQPTVDDNGYICCNKCGRVIDSNYSTEAEFVKTAGGQSRLAGSFINTYERAGSREMTLRKGRYEIEEIITALSIDGGENTINQGHRLYTLAVDKNFTRGRRTKHVAAACLYIVCRHEKKPFLLIDFSDFLQINVYVLGAVFLQLAKLLSLQEHPIVQKPVDPSFFIQRFTARLVEYSTRNTSGAAYQFKKNNKISNTALNIVASMKRDWLQTGRKPSGLCGAALYIAANSYGIKCSKSDVIRVVHICEATLTKRLIEFENTESGSLTLEEFNTMAEELRFSCPPPIPKKNEMSDVLCEHKGSGLPHFAHGLCEECYHEFWNISGGIQGGSEPPAFQRAEQQRMANGSADARDKESDVHIMDSERDIMHLLDDGAMESDSAINAKGTENEAAASRDSESVNESCSTECQEGKTHESGYASMSNPNIDNHHEKPEGSLPKDLSEHQVVDETAPNEFQEDPETDVLASDDESETLSDIDDLEVNGYIHNEEETRLKTIIWTEMNKEYLEEQAAKEAAAAAARAAYEADIANCHGDALELAKATAAAIAKMKKDKQQKRAEEARNATPAQTAAEATRQMLTKKKISSKINYEVLNKLFDEETPAKDEGKTQDGDAEEVPSSKRQRTKSSHGDSRAQKTKDENDRGFDTEALNDDNGYEEQHAGEDYGYENAQGYGNAEEGYGYGNAEEGYGYGTAEENVTVRRQFICKYTPWPAACKCAGPNSLYCGL
ncbi:transcription factor IIIB 60 kDa subunit isoform X1 [Amborella trichopoda]|uniref:transcription factor IIIB 60 kDa subunit isoform X1 n=1 Tax=Amborella trichopoda TaxID=13333 RepID=UPI0005D3B18E|nr:transcription factor IIIB 60 kDa subunit isoform X1 [Amborella trichopoda]|eukprot:XP_011623664.1 transcription factor IIIB 60 kDa subunit isoform X1 [Amborella trichopoda]